MRCGRVWQAAEGEAKTERRRRAIEDVQWMRREVQAQLEIEREREREIEEMWVLVPDLSLLDAPPTHPPTHSILSGTETRHVGSTQSKKRSGIARSWHERSSCDRCGHC